MKNRTKTRLRALGRAIAEALLTGTIAIGIVCASALLTAAIQVALR